MDSDDEYDEFGNYLGSDRDSDLENGENGIQNEDLDEIPETNLKFDVQTESVPDQELESLALTNSLSNRFGNAETILVDSLLEGKDEPVIKTVEDQKLFVEYTTPDNSLPEVTYSREYMSQLSKDLPERIRNVAFVGNLHTGKTSLIDLLVQQTHINVSAAKKQQQEFKPLRYMDTNKLEVERGLTIAAKFASLFVLDSRDRSYILNVADCPGHPDFQDEIETVLNVVEGAVLVIDVLEGFTKRDKRIVGLLVQKNLPFTVVLNKIDRLVLELRLPPSDFHLKVKYILDDINAYIYHHELSAVYTHLKLISPLQNNVVFSLASLQTCFTLQTFAQIYVEKFGSSLKFSVEQLAKLLWGDFSYDKAVKKFVRFSEKQKQARRTFEELVLDPLYKLFSYSLVSDPDGLVLSSLLWENFGVNLPKSSRKQDPQTLLRDVFALVFDSTKDFAGLVVWTLPDPVAHLKEKLEKRGIQADLTTADSLVAEVAKLTLDSDKKLHLAIVRVYQGKISVGDDLQLNLGNLVSTAKVESIHIPCGRYKIPVGEVTQGNVALISGISPAIEKNCTVSGSSTAKSQIVPIHYSRWGQKSVYKVAIEPEHPRELPKLVEGLKILSKAYISAVVKVEESGEHVVLAPGELYLDCFLHDLRYIFAEYLSIKVSDPITKFSETTSERSVTKITTYGLNKKSSLSITAEPVNDKKLSRAIESGQISLAQPQKVTAKILRNDFGWDALAARSIWSFGPDDLCGASMLLDDTLEGETDKSALAASKELICAGFHLAANEGPLCDEPIRNTKFKILDAVLGGSTLKSGNGQLIPITRNAVHTGFLTASPRLMEPMYRVNVICTYKSQDAVHTILGKRRGWIVLESPVPATPLFELEGYVPVIDSVGLDTDLRLYTQGQAFGTLEFARWDIVPGDPLDQDCPLPALKPVPKQSLARDFVMKTRRRKGLSGEPNLQKYLDPELYQRLRESGVIN